AMRLTKTRLVSGTLATASIAAAGLILRSDLAPGSKSPRSRKVPHFRAFDRDQFKTAFAKVSNGGEPESVDGAAQEAYDNRAYPAVSIASTEQFAAVFAANAIGKLPGGKKANWQEMGPSGVSASAQVASESTG